MRFAPVIAVALAACGAIQQQPTPEPQIVYRDNPVEKPVPCFKESDRPPLPEPTPVDLDNATTEQLAAAAYADQIADDKYMRALEDLFLQCQAASGKPVQEIK